MYRLQRYKHNFDIGLTVVYVCECVSNLVR